MSVPTNKGGLIAGFLLLDTGAPYVATKAVVDNITDIDKQCQASVLPSRDFVPGKSKRVLIFFPGGIGDVICLNPCLRAFKQKYNVEVGIVSSNSDAPLIHPWYDSIWDYPVRREVAEYYDAWINIAELDRDSMKSELTDTFASLMYIDVPEYMPELYINDCLKKQMAGFLSGSDRIKIGVQTSSADHYRSLPPIISAFSMLALIDMGCECYLIGTPEHRTIFVDDDKKLCKPPEHIYDMCGALTSTDMFIAFMDNMDAILTVDTAAMHIGGALGKPTVALFGLTDGRYRTSKYKSVRYIQGEADCSPCNAIRGGPSCNEKWCKALLNIPCDVIAENVMEVVRNA